MNPHCRIGKVTPKGNLRLMPKAREAMQVADRMRDSVEIILSGGAGNMAGFATVAWNMDGTWTRAVHFRTDGFVGQTFLPEFVSACLRRDVAAEVAQSVLRGEA
jgi:hypothetical protein